MQSGRSGSTLEVFGLVELSQAVEAEVVRHHAVSLQPDWLGSNGGTCQLIIRWLIHATANPMSPAWYLLAATAIGQIAMLIFPESAPAPRAAED